MVKKDRPFVRVHVGDSAARRWQVGLPQRVCSRTGKRCTPKHWTLRWWWSVAGIILLFGDRNKLVRSDKIFYHSKTGSQHLCTPLN
jgi:hypothetical protein